MVSVHPFSEGEVRFLKGILPRRPHCLPGLSSLPLDLAGGERCVADRVGHEFQRDLEPVSRHQSVDLDIVKAHRGVDHTSDRRELPPHGLTGLALRSSEQQPLDEVPNPVLPRRLIQRRDLQQQFDRNDIGRSHGSDDHTQSIGKVIPVRRIRGGARQARQKSRKRCDRRPPHGCSFSGRSTTQTGSTS